MKFSNNDGRETNFNQHQHERVATTFDAAGRRYQVREENFNTTYNIWQERWNITQGYDGDGQRIMQQENGASWPNYFIRSSVLGGAVVAELRSANGSTWAKDGFVMLGGEIIAQQKQNSPTSADEVKFMYTNPVTGAQRGAVQTEPDPLGTNQGLTLQQPTPPIYSGDSGIMDPGRYADAFNGVFCSDSGAIAPCEAVYNVISRSHGSMESAELQLMFVYSRRQELLQRRSPQDKDKDVKPVLKPFSGRRKKPSSVNLPNIEPKTESAAFDLDGIRLGLQLVWANADCRTLIVGLLDAVQSRSNPVLDGGNPTLLFERLLNKGELPRRTPSEGPRGGAAASGSFGGNDAVLYAYGPGQNPNYTPSTALQKDVQDIVDELLHLAGKNRYSDRDFARAVKSNPNWAASNWQNEVKRELQVYPDDRVDLTRDLRTPNLYSSYWHPVLDNLCFDKVDLSRIRR